jgi:hypothetical protein
MNAYISDSIARQHADTMLANAAAARRLGRARKGSKARTAAPARTEAVGSASAPGRSRRGAAVAHVAAWPFSAAHSWLAAGQL